MDEHAVGYPCFGPGEARFEIADGVEDFLTDAFGGYRDGHFDGVDADGLNVGGGDAVGVVESHGVCRERLPLGVAGAQGQNCEEQDREKFLHHLSVLM